MQKHNIGREDIAKLMEKERKSDQKEMIIRKNIGRLQKQVENGFNWQLMVKRDSLCCDSSVFWTFVVKWDVFGEVIQERFTSETEFLNQDFFKPRLFTLGIVIWRNKDIEC